SGGGRGDTGRMGGCVSGRRRPPAGGVMLVLVCLSVWSTLDHGRRDDELRSRNMSAIDTLMQRNAAFAERRFIPNLPLVTTLGITVVCCVDPRVDPAHVLGLELGEAAGVRNLRGAGTPAGPAVVVPLRQPP